MRIVPPRRRLAVLLTLLGLSAALHWWTNQYASHERDWIAEHSLLPVVAFDGAEVELQNIRDFRYDGSAPSRARWFDQRLDLRGLQRVWYGLSPFKDDWRGPAHSFLSFEWEDGTVVGVSVEARKEQGESYSPWKGLLREYELFYVLATEADLVGLRVLGFEDEVLLYPVDAEPAAVRRLFVDILTVVDEISRRPRWYNTLTNNCTTALQQHVDRLLDEPLGWSWRIALPGYSDELALERGLLDTELPLEQARERFRVNERVRRADLDAPGFSSRLRGAPAP